MQNVSDYLISFPGLGINLGNLPKNVFGLPIRWYGLIIAVGFLLAVVYAVKRAETFCLNEDIILDVLIVATPSAIICGRIYYVLNDFEAFRGHFIDVFKIWNGGIAIYGAIIGAFVSAAICCKVKKVRFGDMADVGSLGLMIGQSIGRWGNFVNREVFGKAYDGLFRMVLTNPEDSSVFLSVHPLFLYESLWNLLGFVLLHFRSKKRAFSGEIMLLYIAWYGFGRGILEGMRVQEFVLKIPGTSIPVSQALGFVSCAAALIILAVLYHRKKKEKIRQNVTEEAQDITLQEEQHGSNID